MTTITYECRDAITLADATHPKYLAEYVLGRGRGKLSVICLAPRARCSY